MENCLIIAGGDLDTELAKRLSSNSYVIGADRGALRAIRAGLRVDLAVGDFDSVSEEEMEEISASSKELIKLNPIKDDTDLEHSFREALKRSKKITILGSTGSRLDHTFSSFRILKQGLDAGADVSIRNSTNIIRLIDQHVLLKKTDMTHKYVSVMPYCQEELLVTMTGFKYNVDKFPLRMDDSRGISNEVMEEKAEITADGLFYLLECDD